MHIRTRMKHASIALSTLIIALAAGCGDDGGSGNAPDSIAGRSLSVTVTGGGAPFSSTGSYVFSATGDGKHGNYQLLGQGGVQSNNGVYSWTKTGDNTVFLLETEESGTLVQNTLTFNTPNSGTIHSSSSNVGGYEDGTFTLN